MIKTKTRLNVIVYIVIILGGLVLLAPFAFLALVEENSTFLYEPSIYLLLILFVLGYAGIIFYFFYKIVTLTLVTTIEKDNNSIRFFYPFKFQKTTYSFDQIIGFRFSEFHTKACELKTIIIKSSDNKQYTIAEFDIANFKSFEIFVLQNFRLKGENFETLTEEQKQSVLVKNKTFDMDQAKAYRESCYFNIGLVFFLIFINLTLASDTERAFGWKAYSFLLVMILFSIYHINRANKSIKRLTLE